MSITVPDFTKARVLVVGDVMLDRYWQGSVSRISPEAPVPVVHVEEIKECPGGAGNVALNVAALGAQATLLGLVGDDAEAVRLKDQLTSAQVSCRFMSCADRHTITKLRVLSQHQQLLRLDFEQEFTSDHSQQLMEIFETALKSADVVILSDYGKGTLCQSKRFIEYARRANIPVFVDPKRPNFGCYKGATVVTPNLNEFKNMAGDFQNETEMVQKARQVLKEYDIDALLITRGAQGMTLVRKDQEEDHIPTRAKEVYDVTGAGDTVIAVLSTAVAAQVDLFIAVALANMAAGIVVTKLGAATVSASELEQVVAGPHLGGMLSEERLLLMVKQARERGKKIVFTNGCFDLLHAGHVQYLEEAKQCGDRLIVAVNDDGSVARLKGANRPLNSIRERMMVLAGLNSVDWVVPFSEDTPERIISRILPDVLVKGGDYKPHEIVGADIVLKNGGEVKSLKFVDGFSTTSVIDRMQQKEVEVDK